MSFKRLELPREKGVYYKNTFGIEGSLKDPLSYWFSRPRSSFSRHFCSTAHQLHPPLHQAWPSRLSYNLCFLLTPAWIVPTMAALPPSSPCGFSTLWIGPNSLRFLSVKEGEFEGLSSLFHFRLCHLSLSSLWSDSHLWEWTWLGQEVGSRDTKHEDPGITSTVLSLLECDYPLPHTSDPEVWNHSVSRATLPPSESRGENPFWLLWLLVAAGVPGLQSVSLQSCPSPLLSELSLPVPHSYKDTCDWIGQSPIIAPYQDP